MAFQCPSSSPNASQESFLVSRVSLSWSTCGRILWSLRSADRSHAGLTGRECGLIKLFLPTVGPKGRVNTKAFQSASTETLNSASIRAVLVSDVVTAAKMEVAVKLSTRTSSREVSVWNSRAVMTTDRPAMPVLVIVAGCLSALMFLGAGAGAVQGQASSDFALFEPVDSSSSAPGRRGPRASADATTSEAEFSLIGTIRIGRRTSVMLRHVSGEEVRVSIERSRMAIPGYEQYAVVGAYGDSVSIQYPQ